MDQKQMSAFFLFIGGLLLVIGAATTWGTVLGIDISGIDTDLGGGEGWYTLFAGVVLALLGAQLWRQDKTVMWLAWVAWVVAAFVGLANFFDIATEDRADLGIGMWLTVVGVIATLIGTLRIPKTQPAAAPDEAPAEEQTEAR